MKERPILFSAPMVRALLDGRKTQTRRTLKVQPPLWVNDFCTFHNPNGDGNAHWAWDDKEKCIQDWHAVCPYGQASDRLWVRETFHLCSGAQRWADGTVLYRADHGIDIGGSYVDTAKWKPSIFMPRWASRITLNITDIRVERLQDISEADAIAEGTTPSIVGADLDHLKYRAGYQSLWECINGAGSWDANPWVWVIGFDREVKA